MEASHPAVYRRRHPPLSRVPARLAYLGRACLPSRRQRRHSAPQRTLARRLASQGDFGGPRHGAIDGPRPGLRRTAPGMERVAPVALGLRGARLLTVESGASVVSGVSGARMGQSGTGVVSGVSAARRGRRNVSVLLTPLAPLAPLPI